MSTQQPLVSVVLTNYNNAPFLARAVQSVLAQTYPNWELIAVDDASADNSAEILASFTDPRITVIRNERNRQVSVSHNLGNRQAKGKYIAAIDSDDEWMPDKLEKQVAYMEAHPETGACFTWLQLMDENDAPLHDAVLEDLYGVFNRTREQWLHELLLVGNHFANDSSLIRSEVMAEIGENNPALVQLHDYDMWLKIALRHDLHVLEEPLMRYRRVTRSTSISSHSRDNLRRLYFEYHVLIGRTIAEMDGQLFRRVFRQEMRDPEAASPAEILCEKALLLSGDFFRNKAVRTHAWPLFERLLQSPDTAALLEQKYHFTVRDLYALMAQPLYMDPVAEQETAELRAENERLRAQVSRMYRLPGWLAEKGKRRVNQKESRRLRAVKAREGIRRLARGKNGFGFGCSLLLARVRGGSGEAKALLAEHRQQKQTCREGLRLLHLPQAERARQQAGGAETRFSIVTPLYNTPLPFLRQMLDSVLGQTWQNWELCLADGSDAEHNDVEELCRVYARKDPRVRYVRLERNGGISANSNAALELASGEYIALLDHDDLLVPSALWEMAEAARGTGADFLYSDEFVFASPNPEKVLEMHLKPDYSQQQLLRSNYICHFTAFRRSLLQGMPAFRGEYDGSQDHDLFLRLTDRAEKVVHVPKPLYFWRSHAGSAAEDIGHKAYAVDAGIRAVQDFLRGKGITARVRSSELFPTIYEVFTDEKSEESEKKAEKR